MTGYKPRRASRGRYLEDAPDYVLSVHDAGSGYADRYAVLLTEPFWYPGMGRSVPFIAWWEGGGTSMGEIRASDRDNAGRKIRWLDLPGPARRGIRERLERPDSVLQVNRLHDAEVPSYFVWAYRHDGPSPCAVFRVDGGVADEGTMDDQGNRAAWSEGRFDTCCWIDLPEAVKKSALGFLRENVDLDEDAKMVAGHAGPAA